VSRIGAVKKFATLALCLIVFGECSLGAEPIKAGKPLKSTTGAVLRSLAVPGWGQLYTHNYIKGAVFFAGEVGLMASMSWNSDQMLANRKSAENAEAALSSSPPPADSTSLKLTSKNGRINEKFFRNQRNRLIWWLAGSVLLSMGDAYVDAHLYGLNITPELTDERGLTARVTATYHF
jgi:hypothetical protein